MVKGVITFGAENWGWKEWKELERIKMKYVRWTQKLNRNTPWHTIRKDTGIRKIAMDAATRAMKFEEKVSRAKEGTLERLSWEQACKDEEDGWRRKERGKSWKGKREFLEGVGISVKEWNDNVRSGWAMKPEIRERMDDLFKNETDREVNESAYSKEMVEILGNQGESVYRKMEVKKSRNGMDILGRFRMGNEARANEYWRRDEEKSCRTCEELETTRHILEECRITGKSGLDWKRQLNGDRISISRVNEVIWKRKRQEVERSQR